MTTIYNRLFNKLFSTDSPVENFFTWIPEIFRKEFIENDGNRKAREMAKNFTCKGTKKGLYIHGGTGVGKSHLAARTILAWCKQNKTNKAEYVNFPSLLFEMQSNFNDREESLKNEYIVSELSKTELLVLDDIGSESISKWSNTILYLLINSRYEAIKPIVVTTNYDPERLAGRIGGRIVSRLNGMCEIVKITNKDWRLHH